MHPLTAQGGGLQVREPTCFLITLGVTKTIPAMTQMLSVSDWLITQYNPLRKQNHF